MLIKENGKRINSDQILTSEKDFVNTPLHAFWSKIFFIVGKSDGVKRGSEWEVLNLPGQGCDAMERERGSKAVSRAGGRKNEAAGQFGLGLSRIFDWI